MVEAKRRTFLGGLALGGLSAGAGTFAAITARAAGQDGHAAGHDVAGASNPMATVPRKPGDPVVFTASLDTAALKATSGGWAREITARQLPIATGLAGAHLFLNPGGIREMHWHSSVEWAYVLDGQCQVTVVDPAGETEVANYQAGDLWYFPSGHAHSIQALGAAPCHAILVFSDGLYSEHGTFGLTDWMSRMDPATLSRATGLDPDLLRRFPAGETYIMQGEVLAADSPQMRATRSVPAGSSHKYQLSRQTPRVESPGGTLLVASAAEFPLSTTMTGMLTRLEPGALLAPHWHPDANEWLYVARGRARVTLFAADKHLAVAELSAGDCGYIPRACGHTIETISADPCEIVGLLDNGTYTQATLADWLRHAPRHALAANLGVPETALAPMQGGIGAIVGKG